MTARVVAALAALIAGLLVSVAAGSAQALADEPAGQTDLVDWYDVSE
jgi:hypothetical protein